MGLIMGEPDSRFMNYVVRMVIPMKREFGRALDVYQFLNDRPYAIEVIEQALQSKDERLREYAAYLEGKMFGPRNSSAGAVPPDDTAPLPAPAPPSKPVSAPPAASAAASTAAAAAAPAPVPSDAELRARMLAKYRAGLR